VCQEVNLSRRNLSPELIAKTLAKPHRDALMTNLREAGQATTIMHLLRTPLSFMLWLRKHEAIIQATLAACILQNNVYLTDFQLRLVKATWKCCYKKTFSKVALELVLIHLNGARYEN
jgi:hypothetical protein